ncbi:MAG TPA: L,D-transpeptidase family protein [Pirellulaceae bacterium]
MLATSAQGQSWDVDDLDSNCRQLVVVESVRGSPARHAGPTGCAVAGPSVFQVVVSGWNRETSDWVEAIPKMQGVIGRHGFAVTHGKREGDGCTPRGFFRLGMAFGRPVEIATRLNYQRMTEADTWVDDPTSDQYNRWVRGKPQAKSYERMLREDGQYDLGIVIEYNTDPVKPHAGSAIFAHIWRDRNTPTSGCVAVDATHMKRLLEWLDARKSPMIRLGPNDANEAMGPDIK